MGGGKALAVVAGGELNGLGVVRSLARADVAALFLDTDTRRATMQTRFAHKREVAALSGPLFLAELKRLRAELDHDPVLFLTQEAGVATVAEVHAEIAKSFRISMPPLATMRMLMDKTLFQTQAEALGFAVPRSVRLHRGDEGAAVETLRFPCVLKPAAKSPDHRLPKAHRLGDAAAARALWRDLDGRVDCAILQEWIEGADSDVYFCLQYRARSGEIASFTGRKTCQWPPLVGGTATCMPAPEAEAELTATTNRFFEAVGFIGMGSMEYKRDRRDGRFLMVEPTVGRTDFQEEIATLNGVNIPYAAWLGEQARPLRGYGHAAAPTAWRDPFGHHNAVKTGASDALAAIAPGMKVADAYFRALDPAPHFLARLEPVGKRLRALAKRKTAAADA